ncbi:MAG: hypothetical protein PHF29_03285 [Candidatus Riflebacteria bacterium]|nr:hypothetical protein [Candidatus Riflebacteria bacterium]
MAKCEVKTGFFILRDCENPTNYSCTICNKNICSRHMRGHPETGAPCCLDCLADLSKPAEKEKNSNYYYDAAWCFGYRRRFYHDSDYQPVYSGNSDIRLHGFDENDIRSFDSTNEGDNLSAEDFDEQSVFDS